MFRLTCCFACVCVCVRVRERIQATLEDQKLRSRELGMNAEEMGKKEEEAEEEEDELEQYGLQTKKSKRGAAAGDEDNIGGITTTAFAEETGRMDRDKEMLVLSSVAVGWGVFVCACACVSCVCVYVCVCVRVHVRVRVRVRMRVRVRVRVCVCGGFQLLFSGCSLLGLCWSSVLVGWSTSKRNCTNRKARKTSRSRAASTRK